MSEDSSISIRDQASLSFAGNVIDAAISFLGLIAFAYVLGADGLGRFYLILSVVQVALFPLRGVGQAVMKRGSEAGMAPNEYFGAGLTVGGLYVSSVVAGVVGLYRFNPELLGVPVDVLAAAASVFGVRALLILCIDTYRSYGKTGRATLVDNAMGIVETVLQVALLAAGLEITGLLAGTSIAGVFVGGGVFRFTPVGLAAPTRLHVKRLLSFAKWSVTNSGVSTLYDRLPVIVLGAIATEAAVGYYSSANRLLMLGSYVGGSVAPALMVKVSTKSSGSDSSNPFADLENASQYVAVLSIALAFGALAMPSALMTTFFGPDFSSVTAAQALVALSLYHVVNPFTTIAYSYIDGIDIPSYGAKATTVALVVRASVVGLFGGLYGLLGVIAAVIVSHLVLAAIAEFVIYRHGGGFVVPTKVVKQVASGALMYLIVSRIADTVALDSWVPVVLTVWVGGVVYVLSLLVADGRFREMSLGVVARAVRIAGID